MSRPAALPDDFYTEATELAASLLPDDFPTVTRNAAVLALERASTLLLSRVA